jgi:acetyl esterase/lipase
MDISVNLPRFVGLLLALFCTNASGQNSETAKESPASVVERWLSSMDKNSDGKITREESTGLMKRFFGRNDANKNGALERDELMALSTRLQKGRSTRNSQPRSGSQNTSLPSIPDDVKVEADVPYRPGESKAWRLDVIMPKQDQGKLRAGIVFVHGGGWRSGDKRAGTFWQGAIDYAQKGYVCITVNYRLTGESPFPACIEDVMCAVRWFRAHAKKYNLDPNRIGGYGNSAGAHLVSMLGLVQSDAKLAGDGPYRDQSSLLQAVCASATPTDFLLFGSRRSEDGKRRPGSVPTDLKKICSPITHVRADAPPFLLIQGTSDNTVNVKHGDTFVAAMKKAGANDVTYIRIDDAGHGVFNQHAERTKPAMAEFFARILGKAE